MSDDGLDGGITTEDIAPQVPLVDDNVEELGLVETISDEHLREYAQGKGYQSVDDVLKSQRDAEIELRRLQSEIDQVRQQMAQEPEYEQVGEAESGPMPDFNELVNIFGGNESAAVDFIVQQRLQEQLQQIVPAIDQYLEERVGPIEQQSTQQALDRTADEIAATFPEYESLAPEAIRLINDHPDRFQGTEGMWSAFGMAQAQLQRERSVRQATEAQAHTIDFSARTQQAARTQADQIVEAIRGTSPRFDDGIG